MGHVSNGEDTGCRTTIAALIQSTHMRHPLYSTYETWLIKYVRDITQKAT